MEDNNKWGELKIKYPSEYKEWIKNNEDLTSIEDSFKKGTLSKEEYEQKKSTLDISIFLIEMAVGLI